MCYVNDIRFPELQELLKGTRLVPTTMRNHSKYNAVHVPAKHNTHTFSQTCTLQTHNTFHSVPSRLWHKLLSWSIGQWSHNTDGMSTVTALENTILKAATTSVAYNDGTTPDQDGRQCSPVCCCQPSTCDRTV